LHAAILFRALLLAAARLLAIKPKGQVELGSLTDAH
jgi:hypothetical protein